MIMKKYLIGTLLILIILVGTILFIIKEKHPINYVIFAPSQNMDKELRELLIKRLESNNILYQIDTDGTIRIIEKDIEKAVVCCS